MIEEHLGAGGMGDVYRAHDLALGRTVALKVLHADSSDDAESGHRARLVREARAGARLQHPGIATFYEAGDAGDRGESATVSFIAMEFVPGETLREQLRDGPLEPALAVGIAQTLLEALAHAHAAGLLHRDIKPENIMLRPDGSAKLLDFGLALPVAPEGDAATLQQTVLTMAGYVVGTPGYVAPEQVQGERADPSSDLFAVGAVLFEMLTGTPAFPGNSSADRMVAARAGSDILRGAPNVSSALVPVLERALAADRNRRYRSAAEFLRDLRAVDVGAAATPLERSIAVLDFANLSGDPDQDWIGAGLVESLVGELATLPGVRVTPGPRLQQAKSELGTATPDPFRLGQHLMCRWVISGGVQRLGPRLRATVQLLDIPTEQLVHATKVDGAFDDLFDLQDRIGRAAREWVVRAGSPPGGAPIESASSDELFLTTPPASVRGAERLKAYEASARARQLFHRMEKGAFDHARALFEEAIRADPSFAPPYAGLASVHALRFTFRTDPAELDSATSYARRAIALDPRLAEPHVWLGYALLRQYRFDEGIAETRRVIELDRRHPYGPYFGACGFLAQGRAEESLPLFQQALALEPGFPFAWVGLGWAHLQAGRPGEAIWCFEQSLALESKPIRYGTTPGARAFIAEADRRTGRLSEARAGAMAGLENIDRTDHMYRDTFRAMALATLGRTALDQDDPAGARAAFTQLEAHIRGRDRTLGGGQFLTQALAGLAASGGGAGDEPYGEATALFLRRGPFDFNWMWGCMDVDTLPLLARAARALGREEEARSHEARLAGLGKSAGTAA
ncbi:MAG: protein kinase domain-containing protein [Candidatus Eiseniibacteriota bacterium]